MEPTDPNRNHIKFLDGIRGLAALYVVLYHVVQAGRPVQHYGRITLRIFGFGHTAVVIFLVLSGYVIMLSSGKMQGLPGLITYAKKRAIRIMPAYYITLIACLALRHKLGSGATHIDIAMHVLLLHNLTRAFSMTITPPMWSVAAEWEIYALFPLMLLLYRRHGSAVTVGAAAVASAAILSLPGNMNLRWTCPWFIAVFAMGMAACNARKKQTGNARNWLIAFVALLPCAAFACYIQASYRPEDSILFDLIVTAATCCLLIYLEAERRRGNHQNPFLRITECRAAVELGAMSYMLYLVHDPLWMLLGRHLHPHGSLQEVALRLAAVAIIVAITWPIYIYCDKKPREALTARAFPRASSGA